MLILYCSYFSQTNTNQLPKINHTPVDEHNQSGLSSSIPSSISLLNSSLKPNDSSGSGKFLTVPGKNSFFSLSSHNTGKRNSIFLQFVMHNVYIKKNRSVWSFLTNRNRIFVIHELTACIC